MEIKYELPNGETLDVSTCCQIHEYYEAACTAEYLLENYPDEISSDDQAMDIAYDVRHEMLKYDIDELDAIHCVMQKMRNNAAEANGNKEQEDNHDD